MLVELQMDSSEPTKRKGSFFERNKRRKGSPCQQDGDSQAAKVTRRSIPELPEVCWPKILMMEGLYSEHHTYHLIAGLTAQIIVDTVLARCQRYSKPFGPATGP